MKSLNFKILIIVAIWAEFAWNSATAQLVPVYSQYLVNQTIINPAYAGNDNCLNINALYRQQWASYEGAPSTRTFSAHSPFRNRKLAVGMNLVNDVVAITSNTLMEGQFAYRMKVSKNAKISFGMGAGLFINKNNLSSLKVNDAGDDVFANNANSTMPTFSFGTFYTTKKYFIGISTLNLTRTTETARTFVYQQPFYLSAGYTYKLSDKVNLCPSVLFKHLKNNPLNADINLFLESGKVFRIGASFRTKEAFYTILQLKLNEQLQVGYAFDYSLSVLRKFHNGSHELSVRYIFQYKTNTVDVKSFE